MGRIDEKTKVPLFQTLTVLPLIVGAVFFIATIFFKAQAAEVKAEQNADAIKEQRTILMDLRERAARMEAMLNALSKK